MNFSTAEIGALARAVGHAPSVHNTQPWSIEPRGDLVDLYERFEVSLPRHDPTGRDRVISCGAALVNLETTVRALGWGAETTLFPQADRPDLVAEVRAAGRADKTDSIAARYDAVFRRHSYRQPFRLSRLHADRLRSLSQAVGEDGTQARVIDHRNESADLAELLGYAARVLQDDAAYQRELTAWTALPESADRMSLPWAGLVRHGTRVPDEITFTARLAQEGLLVVLTPDDTRRDHLHAGAAMQRIWLEAVAGDLVASVVTQPLHLPEVRAGLIERLGLEGYPQLLIRVGYPTPALGSTGQGSCPVAVIRPGA
ncbi:nitroreductase family protein [Amycolatopsis sp. YIM 10]|uniref:Acg family FMN-binding oxidoreductase n=1 Tax=Amycolatopsis sp. YIM 10 TaxID=2653857 RepID=UPI001290114B|nr:nitroreductase family protein [Amycolatopsis sp. YIM 10]QFU89936.1 Putative NAD(P)H nitroreductase [Amycolatopsis sp. YIM 10]